MRIAEDIISFAIKKNIGDPVSFLKRTFCSNLDITQLETSALHYSELGSKKDNKTNLNFYYQIDDYSKSNEKKVCKDMPRIYRNMKDHLKAFEEYGGKLITLDNLCVCPATKTTLTPFKYAG